MDIYELDSYRLSDAVKFHTDLNPRLWERDKMRPEVREALLRIADDFREFLGIDDLAVKDITVSGSNAAYSYTPHSDIDLHLVVDFSKLNPDQVYQELFNAKKYQYNDQHDIKVRGYDVELYVQDSNKPVRSLGEYSIINDDWNRIPVKRRGNLDEKSTKSKYEKLRDLIELALHSNDLEKIKNITDTIKRYRQAGLDAGGEFGPENLAFKMLRTQGLIKKLWDHRADLEDQRLSLAERKKKKKKNNKRFKYGAFGGWFYPGYHNDSGVSADSSSGDSGGSESVQEQVETQGDVIDRFTQSCCDFLGMKKTPRIRLRRDPQWCRVNNTFGRYDPDTHSIELSVHDRHIVDILRTLAHEMTHARQNEKIGLPDDAGETGSEFENEANAVAGQIMRHWAETEPEMFTGEYLKEVDTGQNPQPGDPIDWPEGTVHVKVSDVYDWYKIGQKISNLDRARSQEFGKGVPETILVFSNEPQEEDMIDQLGKLGLSVHDVDPGEHPGEEVDESLRGRLGAAATAACIAGTPGCATTGSTTTDALKTVQTVGRTAQNIKKMGRAGAEEEIKGAVRDALRRQRGQIPEASGYIPTEKQANDPRFKTALTVDIKPGQTGKEANKLGLETDSQGRPELLMKRLGNLLESVKRGDDVITEDEDLFEVKMSPSELQRWAQSSEAEGIQAGFEAELIFRDTARDNNEESEPDYDQDERARDIESVVDFFQGGNNGIGRNQANLLRDDLYEQFQEWQNEQFYDSVWNERKYYEWIDDQIWPDEQDEWRERAAAALELDVEAELTPEQTDEIEKTAIQMFREEAEEQWENQGPWYTKAEEGMFDEFRDEQGEEEWLEDVYPYMSDIENSFGMGWPYYTEGSYSEGRDPEEIGSSLSRALGGAEVKVSSGYHSTSRRPGRWIIEPDGSLDPDEYEDAGLEVVSPPMPLPQALSALRRVIDWANSAGDAYTNRSTGLHMGISLPYSGGDVDYVKLILFMGDQYVLEKFGRAANSYTRSALEKLRAVQRQRRPEPVAEQEVTGWDNKQPSSMTGTEKTAAAMDLMKKNLIELAARFVQDGVGRDKYTSAHLKDGYIEFRSPGGDYLSMDDREETALSDTMLRFARAMYLAGKPNLERKEYAKKLYKLIDAQNDESLKLFLDYSTGKLNAEELKKSWARQVLAKEQPPADPAMKEYEVVIEKGNGEEEIVDTFSARSEADADAQFRARLRDDPRWFQMDLRKKETTAEPAPEKKLSRRAEIA